MQLMLIEQTSDDKRHPNVEKIVQKYIQENQPDEPYLVIGASLCSGKSSLVKMISSKYATDFLITNKIIYHQ
jgi:hypothetical protein